MMVREPIKGRGPLLVILILVSVLAAADPAPAIHPGDDEAPVVSIASPLPHNWYRAPFQSWVEATDPPHDDDIAWVRIQPAGLPQMESTSAPHRFLIDVTQIPDGIHTFNASAQDASGNIQTVSQTFRVDKTAPTVDLTSHNDRDLIIGQATLTATASDDTSGIMRVSFFVDDTFIGARTAPPYTMEWTPYLKIGHHQIMAVSYDRAGNTARDTAMVLVL